MTSQTKVTYEGVDARSETEGGSGTLFRQEAIAARRRGLAGDVFLVQSVGLRITIFLCVLAAVAVVIFTSVVEWQSRQTVVGELAPLGGLASVFPPHAGVVTDVFVELGEAVTKDASLATIGAPNVETDGAAMTEEKISALESEMRFIEQEIQAHKGRLEAFKAEVATRSSIIHNRLELVNQQIAIRSERSEKSAAFLALTDSDNSALSQSEQRRREEAALSDSYALLQTYDNRQVLLDSLASLDADLSERELSTRQNVAELQRASSETHRMKMDANFEHGYLLRAPAEGQITTLSLGVGNFIETNQRVLTILPKGQDLFARLYVPSEAVGFLEIGQTVQIKYAAFPFERYGFHVGTLHSLSESVIISENAPDYILARGKPYFVANVAIPSQFFELYNESIKLKPGMGLTGELVFDSRPLIVWLFSDIFRLR